MHSYFILNGITHLHCCSQQKPGNQSDSTLKTPILDQLYNIYKRSKEETITFVYNTNRTSPHTIPMTILEENKEMKEEGW